MKQMNWRKGAGICFALAGVIIGFFDVAFATYMLVLSLVMYLIFGDDY